MNKRALVMVVILFVLLVLGMLIFAHLNRQEQKADIPVDKSLVTTEEPDALEDLSFDTLELSHKYVNGAHEFSGELLAPTPCHELITDVIIAESFPEQVTIDVTLESKADFCAQVITPIPIELSIPVSPEASFHAHLNGTDVALKFLPAENVGQ